MPLIGIQFWCIFAFQGRINKLINMNTKPFLLLVFISVSWSAGLFAQMERIPVDTETSKIKFQEVIDEPGSKNELFNRSIYWLNDYYKDPVRVTSVRDKATGKIIGKHTIKITQTGPDGLKQDVAFVYYEFTIEVRDERYRYTISDLLLKTASRFEIERWLDKSDPSYDPHWDDYLNQIADYVDAWSANLKEKMKPGPEKKEDVW